MNLPFPYFDGKYIKGHKEVEGILLVCFYRSNW